MKSKQKSVSPQFEIGADSLEKLPELLRKNGTKVLLVHGHRPVEDGLLAKVRILLEKNDFPCANLGQILPNPKYGSVKRGIQVARKENCDIILSLGGGSTLQCAKGIALGLHYKGDVWDFWTGKAKPAHVCPIGSILTNPASSAELSESCTLVKKGKQKTVHYPELVCTFTVMDPKLSMYPVYPTMNQAFGLFEHLFFAWLEKDGAAKDNAEKLMKRLLPCSETLRQNFQDLEARTELYRIGLGARREVGSVNIGIEKLADALSFAFSLPEGSAGSCLFAAWCDELDEKDRRKVAELGRKVYDLPEASYEKTMAAFEARFREMNMPLTIPEAGLVVNNKTLYTIAQNKKEKKLLKKANQKAAQPGKAILADAKSAPETAAPAEQKPEEHADPQSTQA